MIALLVALLVTLVASWLLLVAVLVVARPDGATLADAARVLPDTVGMLHRLARDPAVPRSARMTLWLLTGYLISPVDLIPDFIPVLGYADDAIIATFALRLDTKDVRHEVDSHLQDRRRGGPQQVRSPECPEVACVSSPLYSPASGRRPSEAPPPT